MHSIERNVNPLGRHATMSLGATPIAQGTGGLGPTLQECTGRFAAEQVRHQALEPRNNRRRLCPTTVDGATLGDLLAFLGRLQRTGARRQR